MYESYYGFSAKPFQLKPDPGFYFDSKGHKRAMAYLEYGLSQGEGFIIITGEIGAGKTTLMRNLFRKLKSEKIVAAQIVNTHLNSDDILTMVAAAFGLPYENSTKATLLLELEQFFYRINQQGERALLVVDESQNLDASTLEQLRMLSNYQTDEGPLLQIFLLGQPEFRRTLLGSNMQQLRQRIIATYHLGPMDSLETKNYIEHRLKTVGWHGSPVLNDEAYAEIHGYSHGIPRKINTLCDRMLVMGCLDKIQNFGGSEVNDVIVDFQQEYDSLTMAANESTISDDESRNKIEGSNASLKMIDSRLLKVEKDVTTVLDLLKQLISRSDDIKSV